MNRRNLLRASAYASLGAALPFAPAFTRQARAANEKTPTSEQTLALSQYMSRAAQAALPEEALLHTKYHVLDTFAAILSGSQLAPGQFALRYLREHGSQGGRTVIAARGKAGTAGAVDAALANAMMAHSDETDDSHGRSRSHPGCSVVPSALAAGEEFGISGAHFLRAVALGYDVGPRVLMAMGGPTFSYESHKSSHAIAGVFGSAAAACCAAQLSEQQMRWALDYTAQQSAGIAAWGRDTDHIEKAFVFAGMPARNGVSTALMVHAGWNGIDDIFTGADNYFLAYAPQAKIALLTEKLGERYEITQTDIKKWTVGSPIQGPLDAMELIRNKHPFEADQVRKVTVRLDPSVAKVVDNRDLPDICLQHCAAVMLLDKTLSFKAAHDVPRMQDARVREQRAKVELVHDEALNQFLPVRVAIVEITLADGNTYTERVEAVRGTPRNPMGRDEVVAKARDLIDPILGKAKTTRLIDTVFALEKVRRVGELRGLLQAG